MRVLATIAATSLLTLVAVDTRADDATRHDWRSDGDAPREPERPKRWYGYQMIAADVLLPILGGFVGRSATTQPTCTPNANDDGYFDNCSFYISFAGFANGYGVGMLVAQAIDDGLVAWEPLPNAPVPPPLSFNWTPKLGSARTEGGRTVTTLGISGTF
jgi:hypothetical protein